MIRQYVEENIPCTLESLERFVMDAKELGVAPGVMIDLDKIANQYRIQVSP